MPRDLHEYLAWLECQHPEHLVRITKPIDADQEITALAMALERHHRTPTIIAEHVITNSGKVSTIPVVTNLFGSRQLLAEQLGSTFRDVGRDVFRRTKTARIDPVVIPPSQAPVREVAQTDEAINLFEFPAPVHHLGDPGPYFSGASAITWEPETGIDNTALSRGWIAGSREVRLLFYPQNHNAINRRRWDARAAPMPVAYWQGHHPLACLGGQVRLGYPESHWPATGGLLGEPLRLTRSLTLGDAFLVPADAEVVVEGFVTPNKSVEEGPFGEFHGYMGEGLLGAELTVTAVTRRRDAFWHVVLSGHVENTIFGALVLEGAIYDTVKPHVPSLQQVYVPLAAHRFHAYLQLSNGHLGDAREAIMLALPVAWQLKHVFVFDDDIDIFDPAQVQWALATRTQWDRDVMVFPRVRANQVDPSASVPEQMTKAGVDCTKPVGQKFADPLRVSEEVARRVRIEDFILPERLANLAEGET